jgi:two-component system cell cycle response regulator DivK
VVVPVFSGHEAIALSQRVQPNLVLPDLMMPRPCGLEVVPLVKFDPSITAGIPVIALSALAMKADNEESHAAGSDVYIIKPLRQEPSAVMKHLLYETVPFADQIASPGLSPE